MNPKCLDLLAADGDAAHVPAPEKLEQDQRRHRPVKALPDRRVASVGGIARRPGLDRLDHRVAAAGGGLSITQPLHSVDRKSVVEGKSVSVRVDPGGRRSIKKKKGKVRPHDAKTPEKTQTSHQQK